MTISPARFPAVTVTVVRDRKFRTALRTNQIAGFVTVPSWKKINHIILFLSSFSLETAVALLQESYTVKKEMLIDRKENGKCTNVTNHTGVGGGPISPIFHWYGTFFLDRHSFTLCKIRQHSTNFKEQKAESFLSALHCLLHSFSIIRI